MTRVLACDGVDAKMEVYLPQSLVIKGDQAVRKMRPTIGWYTLDLTSAEKGKVMEPVRVSMSADGKTVTVDQYTRGLPPTAVPVAGGTVDFDQHFGTKAKCGPFNRGSGNACGPLGDLAAAWRERLARPAPARRRRRAAAPRYRA